MLIKTFRSDAASGLDKSINSWLGLLSGAALAVGLTLGGSGAASAQCAPAYHAGSGGGSVGSASSGGGVHSTLSQVAASASSCSSGSAGTAGAASSIHRAAGLPAGHPGVAATHRHPARQVAAISGSVGAKKAQQ